MNPAVASLQTVLFERLVRVLGVKRRLQRIADSASDRDELQRLVDKERRWGQPRPPPRVIRGRHHEEIDIDGFALHLLTNEDAGHRRVILFLHGGGYMFGPFRTEWSMMNEIASATACDLALLDYPKAPEHHVSLTVDVTRRAYDVIVSRYGAANTALVGSSAGGALAVVIMTVLRDANLSQPRRVVLVSPGMDMTLSDDFARLEDGDLLLTADYVRTAGELYADPHQPIHPHVSPMFANLEGLAPLHVFVGSREILLPGVETFARRAAESGTDVHLIIGEGQQHTWPTAPTPEGREAVRQMIEIIGIEPGMVD